MVKYFKETEHGLLCYNIESDICGIIENSLNIGMSPKGSTQIIIIIF